MTFKIKDSLSIDGSVVIDQNKNITANDLTVNGTLTANGSAVQAQLVSGTNIKTVNGTSLLGSGDVPFVSGASIIGEVRQLTSATIPNGWLLCDGSAVSRSTYALLFAAIGTAYGAGDGSTTFNLPDYRGSIGAGVGVRPGQNTTTTLALGDSYTLMAGSSSSRFNSGEPSTIVGIVATNFIIAATSAAVFVDAPGLLTSIDGLTSSKQNTLVSGTNIKTVNGASVLGSGNVDVGGGVNGILKCNGAGSYSAIVSGTDVKTINGTSILGSGDITIASTSLPTQTGNAGKYLSTDGTNASWSTAVDDASTTSTSKSWSASKLNTTLGDISAALAAIIG